MLSFSYIVHLCDKNPIRLHKTAIEVFCTKGKVNKDSAQTLTGDKTTRQAKMLIKHQQTCQSVCLFNSVSNIIIDMRNLFGSAFEPWNKSHIRGKCYILKAQHYSVGQNNFALQLATLWVLIRSTKIGKNQEHFILYMKSQFISINMKIKWCHRIFSKVMKILN